MLDVHELEQWADLYVQQQHTQPMSASPMTYMEQKSRQHKDLLNRFPSLIVAAGGSASASSTSSTPARFVGAFASSNRSGPGT